MRLLLGPHVLPASVHPAPDARTGDCCQPSPTRRYRGPSLLVLGGHLSTAERVAQETRRSSYATPSYATTKRRYAKLRFRQATLRQAMLRQALPTNHNGTAPPRPGSPHQSQRHGAAQTRLSPAITTAQRHPDQALLSNHNGTAPPRPGSPQQSQRHSATQAASPQQSQRHSDTKLRPGDPPQGHARDIISKIGTNTVPPPEPPDKNKNPSLRIREKIFGTRLIPYTKHEGELQDQNAEGIRVSFAAALFHGLGPDLVTNILGLLQGGGHVQ